MRQPMSVLDSVTAEPCTGRHSVPYLHWTLHCVRRHDLRQEIGGSVPSHNGAGSYWSGAWKQHSHCQNRESRSTCVGRSRKSYQDLFREDVENLRQGGWQEQRGCQHRSTHSTCVGTYPCRSSSSYRRIPSLLPTCVAASPMSDPNVAKREPRTKKPQSCVCNSYCA